MKWVRRLLMLWRIMLAGMRNFLRNAWLNLAATVVMVITLTIILLAVVFNMALGETLDKYTEQVDLVSIYLQDGASEADVDALRGELEAHDNVLSTDYTSKQEALEQFRIDQETDQPDEGRDIVDAVSEDNNPLPASIEARVHDIERITVVNDIANQQQYASIVDETSLDEDDQRTINRISNAQQFLITFGLSASLVFAAISMLIIFNTIRIAIYARSEEIGIMRLIGATNGFIRGPFLFEAMLNGIIGASLAVVLVYLALFRGLGGEIEFVDFGATLQFFGDAWPLVVVATLALGMVIGILSSALAMARHLRL